MKVIISKGVENFIKSLETKYEARVKKQIYALIEFGHNLRMPDSKMILPGIFELRIAGQDQIRLIFTYCDEDVAIIFYAFFKKTERISDKEIRCIKSKFRNLYL